MIVSGMVGSVAALFTMGSNYWGGCFAIGSAFFVLAAVLPLHLSWAPLAFGTLWGLTLAGIGWRLGRIAARLKAEGNQEDTTVHR